MTSRRMRAAGLLAAAALGVTACGSDEATDATPSSSATSESASPSEETSAEETPAQETTSEDTTSPESEEEEGSDDAPAAELTKPGTELKLGETAVIPQGDDGATLELTVTEVTKGSSADLSQLKDADKYKGYTPVYVQYTMTGTDSSADLGGDVLDDVDPITSDGRKASTLVIIGTSPFAKCDRNSVPDDFGPGDTETTCDVAMVQGGQEVSGAQYSPYDGDYADDGAIVWTK